MFKKFFLFVLCVLFVIPQSFAADLLTLVPSEAGLVLRANIKQLTSIPEIKKNIEEIAKKQGKEYFDQVKDTGFDPLNDIHSLVAFMPMENIQKADGAKANVAFIAQGNFNVEKLLEVLKDNKSAEGKVEISVEDGFQTVTHINEAQGNSKMLFFDNNTVVIGTETGVESVKAIKLSKKGGILTKKDFAVTVQKLNPNATIAVAVDLPNEAKQFLGANEQSKALSTIKFLSLDLTLKTDLDINITGDFDSNAKMADVEKCLKTFGDILKSDKSPYGALDDFANNYKVAVHNLSATVSTMITKASINKLIESKGKPETK